MSQFTVPGLARLLANVEREVLVEALEEAELSQLLTSDTIKTVAKLGRALEDFDSFAGLRTKESIVGFVPPTPFGLEGILNFWQALFKELGILDDIKRQIANLEELLEADDQEEPDDTPIDVIRKLIQLVNEIVEYQQQPHKTHHLSADADNRLESMENIVRDLIATVPGQDI